MSYCRFSSQFTQKKGIRLSRKRDWQMLTGFPPEWDILNDILPWMCRPYSNADILKWYPIVEKDMALQKRPQK